MALHAGHLHHHLRQQLAALRHELVAGRVCARGPGPGSTQRGPLRHRSQVVHLSLPVLHRGPGDHRLRRTDDNRAVSDRHHCPHHAEHHRPHHQRRHVGLHLHEDGSVQPASGDADLQPSRRHRRQKQPPVFHDPHRGSEEEYDHRCHRQAAGGEEDDDTGGGGDPHPSDRRPDGERRGEQQPLPPRSAHHLPRHRQEQPTVRPVGHGAAVQRPGGHRHPGGRRGDDWHHHAGPDLLRVRGDPVGSPLRSHSDGGGGGLLGGLLQVWQHSEGDHAALQRPRAGREAVHPDPDPAEERAVAPELAEEEELDATQQLHEKRRRQQREPAQEQLSPGHAQSPVLHPARGRPEPERRHLTRGPAAAPRSAQRQRLHFSCSDGTRSGFVSCHVSFGLSTLSMLMILFTHMVFSRSQNKISLH